ncbi:MAG TPA: hypothetical protein VKF17_16845 [Isosphaeraceae bacterium]|nr:hypothetical protein [Isosphaeraceae bacterium]
MPVPQTFGRLARAWTACPHHDAAADLIARYSGAARRMISWTQSAFPGEDLESLAAEGLYLAAYTWTPERNVPFLVWLKINVSQATSSRRHVLHRRKHILRRAPESALESIAW